MTMDIMREFIRLTKTMKNTLMKNTMIAPIDNQNFSVEPFAEDVVTQVLQYFQTNNVTLSSGMMC